MPAYFLTWTTYGTWLRGDPRGSVTRDQNTPDTPFLEHTPTLQVRDAAARTGPPFTLSHGQRVLVQQTIHDHCGHRGWLLHAINARTNHVHVVCDAPVPPEKAMGEFKAWSSRRLREADPTIARVWTRHGSTRWLDSEASLQRAIEYVLHEQ